jgi:tRNA dimethylallyltransferase
MPSRGDGEENKQAPLIAIVGPTGVGKTRIAVALGLKVGGEIISADSRQIYRGMDIGTAKPTAQQRELVAHRLVDIVAPDQEFTLAQYQELAYQAIEDVLARDKVPFLVGGTGLYVRAVLEGYTIPRVQPNVRLREALLREAEREGHDFVHGRLAEVDPQAAANIDPRNVRRVIRALEVYEALGRPISQVQDRQPPPYRVLKIGLTMDRDELYRRLDDRVDSMMSRGLLGEIEDLVAEGYDYDLPAMSGLGYQQLGTYLRGETDLATAVTKIKSETHRFVRQQYKWFRLDDETIRWFDVGDDGYEAIEQAVAAFLKGAEQGGSDEPERCGGDHAARSLC